MRTTAEQLQQWLANARRGRHGRTRGRKLRHGCLWAGRGRSWPNNGRATRPRAAATLVWSAPTRGR